MNLSNGRIWPYSIAFLITMVFGFCVATVIVTSTADIQESDLYMEDYHQINADINDIIEAKIAFNKKYKIEFLSNSLSVENTALKFVVRDLDLNPVDGAKFEVVINGTTGNFQIDLKEPTISDGIYRFESVKLPKEGIWNILVKVKIDDLHRFYNLKADTITKEIFDKFEKIKVGKRIKKLVS
ncbi:MAG: FixH family protein [Sulfurimonas sp.]|nr:FixH family protein [Sulfurimonas sp.]